MRYSSIRHITLVAILSVLSFTCMAQRGQSGTGPVVRTSIRGTVRDAVTHRALERVVVMIEAEDSGYAGQAETDASGKFDIQGLGAGSYSIRVRFPGYLETVQHVDLTTNPMSYLSFELWPKPRIAQPAVAPEGPEAYLNARLAAVPQKARKEFAKGRELWQAGIDPQGCVGHLNKAIQIYPQFADAYVLLATVYVQQSKTIDAKLALDQAIQLNPKLPEAHFTLGMLQNREKDYVGAEKSLTEGLKLNEASPEGHYELAKSYSATGKWQEAQAHVEKAISLQPNFASAHVLLGNVLLRKGDANGALSQFKEYLKIDPQGPMAEQTRMLVAKIEKALASAQ
jgi:tetratricopeptide (TPR) repeat protein